MYTWYAVEMLTLGQLTAVFGMEPPSEYVRSVRSDLGVGAQLQYSVRRSFAVEGFGLILPISRCKVSDLWAWTWYTILSNRSVLLTLLCVSLRAGSYCIYILTYRGDGVVCLAGSIRCACS